MPPAGHRIRPPQPEDVGPLTAMIRECETADSGAPERIEEDLVAARRTMDTARDVWLVEDGEGRIVASAALRHRHPTRMYSFVAVLPRERGRGLGTELLGLAEERALEAIAEAPPGAQVALGQGVGELNDGARRLLERHGYAHVRRFWRMEIELDGVPPPPVWADGIRVETLREGGERAVFEAMEEAFQDHWGHLPHRYEEWLAWNVERESFDPSLWFLALDGEEIAGASLCAVVDGQAWVNVLGVRRPWRRRRLGLALLEQSFGEFFRRGRTNVVLEVDSENPTGATGLYERAGMRVARQSDAYEKVLREGSPTA